LKIGDLVRYVGWGRNDPYAIIVDQKNKGSKLHHAIRVMWAGKELPVQAGALSVSKGRVTTWISPRHFEVVSEI